jgi:hypothetical protein
MPRVDPLLGRCCVGVTVRIVGGFQAIVSAGAVALALQTLFALGVLLLLSVQLLLSLFEVVIGFLRQVPVLRSSNTTGTALES